MSSTDLKAAIVAWVKKSTFPTLPNPNPDMNYYTSGENSSHWKRRSKFVRSDGSIERVFEISHGAKAIKPGMILRDIPGSLITVEHTDGTIDIAPVSSQVAQQCAGYKYYWE